jgi:hypothetical protein
MGSEWERHTARVTKQPPYKCKLLLQCAPKTIVACANYAKTAPLWSKTAPVWAKHYCSMRQTIAVCAKNYCRMRQKLLSHAPKCQKSPRTRKIPLAVCARPIAVCARPIAVCARNYCRMRQSAKRAPKCQKKCARQNISNIW